MYNNPIGYKSCLRLQHQFWLWTVNPKTNLFTLSCRQKLLTESTLKLLVKQMSYKFLSSNYNRLQVLACNRSKCKGISSKPVSCHVHLETFPPVNNPILKTSSQLSIWKWVTYSMFRFTNHNVNIFSLLHYFR